MGFATAPSVLRAMRERLEHPCFGYFEYPQEYYDRIAWWHERRNGVVGLNVDLQQMLLPRTLMQ